MFMLFGKDFGSGDPAGGTTKGPGVVGVVHTAGGMLQPVEECTRPPPPPLACVWGGGLASAVLALADSYRVSVCCRSDCRVWEVPFHPPLSLSLFTSHLPLTPSTMSSPSAGLNPTPPPPAEEQPPWLGGQVQQGAGGDPPVVVPAAPAFPPPAPPPAPAAPPPGEHAVSAEDFALLEQFKKDRGKMYGARFRVERWGVGVLSSRHP
jgi:hypothetical protein